MNKVNLEDERLTCLLTSLPKVELHVHLEGATDAETVWCMAQRNGVQLPAESLADWKEHYAFRDFPHFIEVYGQATAAMQSPADWQFMLERFAQSQAEQNIVYSEVFLSASYHLRKIPADEWLAALVEGARTGESKYGVQIRFIPDISRHLPETQEAVLEFVLAGKKTGYVIGLGLGGMEVGFPASLFVDTFDEARRAGLHVVAHAGETTGAQTIRDAIKLLRAERIGHGIRCLDDPDLVAMLNERQTPLEVCPTSNYCLGVVKHGTRHPIRQMVDAGLFCTVNSDDPPMFNTSLINEYRLLSCQGFTWRELVQLNLNAVQASFLMEAERNRLISKCGDNRIMNEHSQL